MAKFDTISSKHITSYYCYKRVIVTRDIETEISGIDDLENTR